jgi:hypothetical protein
MCYNFVFKSEKLARSCLEKGGGDWSGKKVKKDVNLKLKM